jgi:DNA-binding response OmpR family regulator
LESLKNPALQIVLAEDNEADAALVRRALLEAGVECVLRVMKDGEQAISFIETLDVDPMSPPIDLLLVDMHLPKCDGEDILRRLRSTDNYSQTPVIVMSSSGAARDYESARKHAAIHYFRKPFSLDEFMEIGVIVRTVVAERKASNKVSGRSRTDQEALPDGGP